MQKELTISKETLSSENKQILSTLFIFTIGSGARKTHKDTDNFLVTVGGDRQHPKI
jgi:hypothetical protein